MRSRSALLPVFAFLHLASSQIPGPPSLREAIEELSDVAKDPDLLKASVRGIWLPQHISHLLEESVAQQSKHSKVHSEVSCVSE